MVTSVKECGIYGQKLAYSYCFPNRGDARGGLVTMDGDRQRYVAEGEVARITGMALSTLRNQRSQGRGIPYVKLGRSVRYRLDEVFAFMESRKVETDRD